MDAAGRPRAPIGASPSRIATDRVAVAVFGVPGLEKWAGVIGACRNWRRGPRGPEKEEIKRAREAIAAARPREYHRAGPPPGEEDRAAGAAWAKEWRAMLDAAGT